MKIYLLSFFLVLGFSSFGQRYYMTNDGEISFFSKTPLEDISAVSKKGSVAINTATNEILVKIKMTTFKFQNGLMQEHFNENYMESEKFPDGVFTGKIQETIDFKKDGVTNVTAKGVLTMHGVAKERTLTGTIEIKRGVVVLKSEFSIPLDDHKIERPSIVMMKIADKIDVKSIYTLSPK